MAFHAVRTTVEIFQVAVKITVEVTPHAVRATAEASHSKIRTTEEISANADLSGEVTTTEVKEHQMGVVIQHHEPKVPTGHKVTEDAPHPMTPVTEVRATENPATLVTPQHIPLTNAGPQIRPANTARR